MMAFNQQFVRNILIIALALVIGRRMVGGWKNFKKKRVVARIESRAKQVDMVQRIPGVHAVGGEIVADLVLRDAQDGTDDGA